MEHQSFGRLEDTFLACYLAERGDDSYVFVEIFRHALRIVVLHGEIIGLRRCQVSLVHPGGADVPAGFRALHAIMIDLMAVPASIRAIRDRPTAQRELPVCDNFVKVKSDAIDNQRSWR